MKEHVEVPLVFLRLFKKKG